MLETNVAILLIWMLLMMMQLPWVLSPIISEAVTVATTPWWGMGLACVAPGVFLWQTKDWRMAMEAEDPLGSLSTTAGAALSCGHCFAV